MENVDPVRLLERLDKSNVYGSVINFSDQVIEGWEETEKTTLPPDYFDVSQVIVAAMGGSSLSARVIESLFTVSFKVPMRIVNDYELPSDIDPRTLVIASSYSGNTEEVLSAYRQAVEYNCQVFIIGAGGRLIQTAQEGNLPFYKIEPHLNPSNQPRMALGYSLGSLLEIFSRLKLINLKKAETWEACRNVKKAAENYFAEKTENEAFSLAKELTGKIPVLVGAGHIVGSIQASRNQINENAKNFAAFFALPELNHHLMEGLRFPLSNRENLAFVFFESKLYHPRIQKRILLSRLLTEKNGLKTFTYEIRGTSKLEQALEVVSFGAFVGFYLSLLNGVDPAPIPVVEWFKEEMETADQDREARIHNS